MGDGKRLELPDRLDVLPERVLGVDARLQRRQAHLLQACDLALRERLVLQVGERRPPPQRQRLAQHPRRRRRRGRARLLDERFEALQVQLPRLDVKHVTRCPGHDDVGAERAAEMRDVHLQRLAGGLRRSVAPQLVDEPLGRDHLVAVQEEKRQQRPLLRRLDGNRAACADDLQRAKYPEFHPAPNLHKRARGVAGSVTSSCAGSATRTAGRTPPAGRRSRPGRRGSEAGHAADERVARGPHSRSA